MKRLISLLLLTVPLSAALADDAGNVLFAKGTVTAEREPPVALAKGDVVLTEDTVATGEASRAQLLMVDGAKIAIRPNSRLVINEYAYTAPGAASVSGTDDKSVMTLVKGGFRTITGAIGKDDEEDYEVRTPVGVLGIRGTDYTAVFCRGDCTWAPGVTPGTAIQDGLYLGVVEGTIVFTNAVQQIEVTAGQFVFIPLESQQPEFLDVAPPVLLDDNDLRFDATASGRTGFDSKLGTRRSPDEPSKPSDSSRDPATGDDEDAPKQPVLGTDPAGGDIDLTPGLTPDPPPDPQTPRSVSYATGPLGFGVGFSFTEINEPMQITEDANGDLEAFTNAYPERTGLLLADFAIGTSANTDTGSDSMTFLRWGRWSGGTADVTLSSGNDASQSLANQSLHWIVAPNGDPPVIPITGTANYSLIGNTSPTDDQGNIGVLGSATFSANFTDQSVTSFLDITINGANWIANGSGFIGALNDPALPAHLFSGFYQNVAIDGIGGGNGVFTGFFSQQGQTPDPAIPAAAGLTYSISDAQNSTTVSGAAAFGNPQTP